jgi:hypothetical protein
LPIQIVTATLNIAVQGHLVFQFNPDESQRL